MYHCMYIVASMAASTFYPDMMKYVNMDWIDSMTASVTVHWIMPLASVTAMKVYNLDWRLEEVPQFPHKNIFYLGNGSSPDHNNEPGATTKGLQLAGACGYDPDPLNWPHHMSCHWPPLWKLLNTIGYVTLASFLGLLSWCPVCKLSHCNSLEEQALKMLIYMCVNFKWVAETWLQCGAIITRWICYQILTKYTP